MKVLTPNIILATPQGVSVFTKGIVKFKVIIFIYVSKSMACKLGMWRRMEKRRKKSKKGVTKSNP